MYVMDRVVVIILTLLITLYDPLTIISLDCMDLNCESDQYPLKKIHIWWQGVIP